tara:strand:- start:14239 stop:15471 length:1233 start_codon:yes stop_codon:yes gene_type:complete
MARFKKNYLNGSLFGNFNSNPSDKFDYLFTNIVDAHYDYLLGKEQGEFQAISLSDIATGQSNGTMLYPNSARIITRQVIKAGIPSESRHLAIKVRPTNIEGSILPDPFQATNQDERNFAIGMHEWAVSDVPFDDLGSVPAGAEVTCFYSDGRELGFSEKQLFFKASSVGTSFMSVIAQGFGTPLQGLQNLYNNAQGVVLTSEYSSPYINMPPRWEGVLPTIPAATITSPFGPRIPPVTSGGRGSANHPGIDLAGGNSRGGRGTPIFAVNNGTVVAINQNSKTAGKLIYIKHAGGWQTEYMHLDSILVGYQDVSKGQIIGTMGNSGNSSGTHLHFGVRKDGKVVDPLLVFQWGYGWNKESTKQNYLQRLASAGVKLKVSSLPATSSPNASQFPPESTADPDPLFPAESPTE